MEKYVLLLYMGNKEGRMEKAIDLHVDGQQS
jgi:hypothetical protein